MKIILEGEFNLEVSAEHWAGFANEEFERDIEVEVGDETYFAELVEVLECPNLRVRLKPKNKVQ